jgi:hypothetical protein
MEFDTTAQRAKIERTIRSTRRWRIIAPFVIGFMTLVGLVIVAALVPRTNLTANVLLTVFIVCPFVIVLFGFFMLLTAAVYGMGRLNETVSRPLAKVETFSAMMSDRVGQVAGEVNRQAVNLGVRTAPIEQRLDHAFDQPVKRKETRNG